MKQPKPERLVVTLGIPITVHSAGGGQDISVVKDRWTDRRTDRQAEGSLLPDNCTGRWDYVTRCVSPRLVVGGEHSEVTTTNKVFIVHGQQRTSGGQELRMEYDLKGQET